MTVAVLGSPTFDADVGGREVGDEVLATRLDAEQVGIRNRDGARPVTRTSAREVRITSETVPEIQPTSQPRLCDT